MNEEEKNDLEFLSHEMLLNEVRKLQIENSYYYAQKEGNRGSIYSDKEGLEIKPTAIP